MTPMVVEYMAWIGECIKDAPDHLRIRVWWNQFRLLRGTLDWDQEITFLSLHLQNIWRIYDTIVKGTIIEMDQSGYEREEMRVFIKEFVRGTPKELTDLLKNETKKKKQAMKKVVDNIINSGPEPLFIELSLKCPKCNGTLYCNLYPEYILYVCGTYNCGFHKEFNHSELLKKDLEFKGIKFRIFYVLPECEYYQEDGSCERCSKSNYKYTCNELWCDKKIENEFNKKRAEA